MPKIRAENTTKREIIITKAAKLFKEKGYKASSMRELAAQIGVEAASLYNHISSKGDLLRLICFEVSTVYYASINAIEKDNKNTISKIEKLLRFHVSAMIDNYEKVYVTDHDWRNLEEPYLSEYRELRRNYRKKFTAIVQQGIEENELKQIDANSIVMIFINAIGAIDQWHRIIHKVDSQTFEDIIVAVLIDGVRK